MATKNITSPAGGGIAQPRPTAWESEMINLLRPERGASESALRVSPFAGLMNGGTGLPRPGGLGWAVMRLRRSGSAGELLG